MSGRVFQFRPSGVDPGRAPVVRGRASIYGGLAITGWETTGRIGKESLAGLAAATGRPIEYFIREAPPAASWDDVLGYSQAVGLGKGAEAQEYAETHKLKFRAESLAAQGLKPQQLAVMYGEGDSMLPRVRDGDAILFDMGDTRARDGALYVVQVQGAGSNEYQVKRALILDDAVYFTADNPNGDHSWRKPRRADAKRGHIEIIGRVRWIGSWEE
jgi:phage repressor protein C with HTH and peptisase S24 domain